MNTSETKRLLQDATRATDHLGRLRELKMEGGLRLHFPLPEAADADPLMEFYHPIAGLHQDFTKHPLTEEEADTIRRIAEAVLEREIKAAEQKCRDLVSAVSVVEGVAIYRGGSQ